MTVDWVIKTLGKVSNFFLGGGLFPDEFYPEAVLYFSIMTKACIRLEQGILQAKLGWDVLARH